MLGRTGGFDEDVVELVAELNEAADKSHAVTAHVAANAATVHLEDFLVGVDDEFTTDADLAEFVFDHSDMDAVVLSEDAVEQGGLAGAKKADQAREGESLVVRS